MVQSFRRAWLLALGGTLVLVSACSGGGGEVADTTSPVEESTVVVETSVADSLVPDSLVSEVFAPNAAQATISTATTEAGAQAERLTVAEAQLIVDDLNHKVGDAYRLAKQGDLGAARAKLAEAATGDQLEVDLEEFADGNDLSMIAALPGDPEYLVVRVSDTKGRCTTLAGRRDITPLFADGLDRSADSGVFLRREAGHWKFEFTTESDSASDLLC